MSELQQSTVTGITTPLLTIAIPLLNEEDVLPELLKRLRAVAAAIPNAAFELLFVDDGSSDRTFALLSEAAASDSRISIIKLSRNFGHQAALTAALQHARGDAVILMDGDLQDPPELVNEFVRNFRNGADVVYAYRARREGNIAKRICYFLFYRLLNTVSGTPIPLDSGDFCLLSRRVVDVLNSMPERHRFLRGLRSWVGFRHVGLPMERPERYAGTSKYPLQRLLRLALDGIFSFSVVPLRLSLAVGCITIVLSALFACYALYARLVNHSSPSGFTAIIIVLVLMSGIQLLSLGIIGEYVGRIFEQGKERPHFVIDRIVRGTISEGRGH